MSPADVATDLYGLTTAELRVVGALVRRLKYGTWRKDAATRHEVVRQTAIEASLGHLLALLQEESFDE